jgi:phosphoserine phosphatase
MEGYVRIYDAMHDLVSSLQENGFDVYVISASAQPLAEVVGSQVGVAADHVVGVRNRVGADGRYLAELEPCGTLGVNQAMTYDQGKRCWINKAVFHRAEADQLPRSAEASLRPAFAAGDSDTDLAMVQDATELKLVLNRNKLKLMCNAYSNAGGRWLIQPMFIGPMPRKAEPYPCATAGEHGGPLLDEDGKPIAVQQDTVFGP